MGGLGTAHGKLILFGEHAAVHGHPAVGLSLPESTTVTLGDEATEAWVLGGLGARERSGVLGILAKMEGLLRSPPVRGSVGIASTVPRGVGFGSSAALCGACARALIAATGGDTADPAHARAWELAHAAEAVFHGTPSGVDTGLSLQGGLCALFPRPAGLPAVRRIDAAPLWLVVAGVPRDGACATLVGAISARMKAGDRAARDAIDSLGSLSRQAVAALEGSGPDAEPSGRLAARLAAMAGAAMEHLRRIGLANPAQDRLIAAGTGAGALGGKLSGAGAGGAFYLIAADGDSARAVARRVREEARSAGISLSAPARVVRVGGNAGG